MPFLETNGISLYYEVHGSGPALLFAHGQGGNHLVWWQQVPFFAQHYTCITFDARAFGQSHDIDGKGRSSFGADVIALLQHLGVDDVRVVAHSMGGRVGIAIALRSSIPCRALVLSGTNGGAVDDDIRARQESAAAARGPALGPHSVAPEFKTTQPDLWFLYQAIGRLNPPRPRDFLALPPGFRGSTAERLAACGARILYLVGEHDFITPPDMIEMCHRIVPGSTYAVIPGSGHSTYFERPDAFNQSVLDFLRAADATPPSAV
ncbi:MAG TPA: alpha/beta hydrolase [Dehalococcoidia bacterium]